MSNVCFDLTWIRRYIYNTCSVDSAWERWSKFRNFLFLICHYIKIFQNTVFFLVEIQILIDFYALTWWEKDTFKLVTSLVNKLLENIAAEPPLIWWKSCFILPSCKFFNLSHHNFNAAYIIRWREEEK